MSADRALQFQLRTVRRPRQGGFNFTEVLFAVMILGIGFIMIAAIFPVALLQSKATMEETNAAGLARGNVTYLDASIPPGSMPATGTAAKRAGAVVAPGPGAATALWNAVQRNLVFPGDKRYGAVILYRRDGDNADATQADWSPFAQVIVIPVAMRNQGNFASYETSLQGKTPAQQEAIKQTYFERSLQPQAVTCDIASNRVTFTGAHEAAVEGAYLVIADDNLPAGRLNGRLLRLGPNVAAGVWDLAPGSDLTADPGPDELLAAPYDGDNVTTLTGATAFIVGRGFEDPAVMASERIGAPLDMGVYTTFVTVR